MKDPQKTFNKGQLVKPTALLPRGADRRGWRRLTHDERQDWYEKFYEDCRNGKDVWHDSAGESRLAPSDTAVPLVEGRIYQVTRGRVRAPSGYGSVPGAVEILCTVTGKRFFVTRDSIDHV